MGTDYEYMVVGVYDDYSGYGKQAGNLIQNKIETLDGYLVESLTSTQNSISLKLEQLDETATIKQIQLLLNNQVIETKEYSKVVDFANLLSDNEYLVEVTYTYLKDEVERTNKVVLDIVTKAKQAPTISLNKFTSSKKEVEYGLEISDIDNVSTDLTITLYHDSVKVAESKNLTDIFDRLYSNSEYRLEVKNSYDLNDGAGVQEITLVDTIKTKELEVPTVDLAYSFTKNEISYTTVYTDEDNTVQKVVYKLYKGTSIIETAKSKDYVFANLQSNTEYKIVLVYYYDLNDNQKIITEEKEYVITTLKDVPTINLAVSNITSSTVNVTSSLNDINNVGKIISVGIYLNNVLIEEQLDVNNFKFENLNANTKYKVVVKAQYDLNDGNGSMIISKEIEFTSLMKKPVVSLDLTSTKKTINYQVIFTDENKVFKLVKVEILKDGVTVQETTSLSNIFENLQSSTNYVVKVTYSFEINDGLGKQTIELSNNIKTKDLTVPTVGMNVISSSDKSITTKIVTSDNDNILNIKEINIYQANNLVQTFSSSEVYNDLVLNTAPNTEYRYVVSYEYDLNNGLGVQQETYEYKVTSSKEMPVINLTSYFVTQHEMEYNLMISDPNASGRVNMISLYQGSTFVERLDETSTKVDNLLSNTPYTIKVNYIYDFNDGLGSREINYTYNFTTLKEEPTFEIVESTRTKDSLEIRYDINDVDSALSLIKLELLLDEKVLKTYTNLTDVLFEDLLSNNQYKLVATFNKNINTGDETHTRVIYINTLSLETPSVDIDLDSTRTTVSYSYLVNDPDKISTVKSIDLYYQGNKLDIKAINNQYSNLYTDSEYELVITLLNDYHDGKVAKEETYRKTIRTDYHQIPSVDVELTSTVDTINFKFIESDIYDLLKVNKVNIYKGQSLIKEVTDLTKGKVTGLESNTLYRVEIVYEYDLNDNNGKHTQSFERSYSTLAHNVKVLGYELLNSGAPKTNEEISLNIKLENESKVELAYIVVNGEKLTVSGGDKQNNIVVVIRAPKTSGIFNISVDKIGYFLNGVEVEQMIETIEDINIEIMSRLDIVSANTLDLSTVIPSYSEVGLMLIIDNPYGYKIDSYVIHGTTYKAYMIDDNHIYLPDYYVCYNSYINISKVTYFDDKGNITSRNYDYSYNMNITYLSSSLSKIKIIQTPEDFINMESGYAYELGNDIDMSGYSCDAKSFSGYFDGKGHTIKNLSIVHENEYSYDTWSGIFSQLDGTFKNVFFDNVYLHIESNNIYTHLLYGNGNPELSNVLFKGAVVLTYDNYHSFEMPSGDNIYIVDSLTLNKVKYQYKDTITLNTFNSENFKLNTLGWDFGAKKFGEYQGFIYTIIDNSYIFINGYEGKNPELVIPENINGYPVIGISDYAFENLNTITSILVPEGIKHIGEGFINNCNNLESITIKDLQTSNLFNYNTLTSVKYLSLTSSKKSLGISFNTERFNMNSLIRVYLDGVIVNVENADKLEELTIKNVEWSGSFRYCDSLKTITFENVTNIHSWSFDNNISLVDVNINEGTKIIDEYAFYCCHSLTNVSLPNTLTEIKANAFGQCASIQSIIIPKSVEKIGAEAFNHVQNIFAEAESKPTNWNDNFTNVDCFVVYNFHSLYSDGQFDYAIKNDATATILKYNGNSTNLEINETFVKDSKTYTITSIGSYVFSDKNIEQIVLPDTIEYIGIYAFYNSYINTIELPSSLKIISTRAFDSCQYLENITIPEGVEYIGAYAFSYCNSLSYVSLPSTLIEIDSYAFGSCNRLLEIFVPKSVEIIKDYGLYTSDSYITIYCEKTNKPVSWSDMWTNVNANVIWNSGGLYMDSSFKYLLNKDNTAKIIKYIGSGNTIVVPNSINYNNNIYSVNEIYESTFTSCYENKSIYIPSSVSVLSASVFADHSNFSIYCEVKEKPSGWDANWAGNCSTKMNCAGIYSDDKFEYILSKDFTATVTKYIGEDTDVVINQTIKYNNKTYTITEIGDSVFSTMAGMGNPVPEITSIVMPNSITYIGGSAFAYCSKLTSVVLPESLTHIGSYAFQGCEKLTNITLPDNLEKIGEGAFSYCSSLTSIIIPNKVKEISTYTFGYSTSLKEVVLSTNLTTIGNNAFESCSGLLLINIPASVNTIGSYAFNGCSKLASISIPASVETIENNAFSNCTALNKVELSEGLISIGGSAFAGCSGLKEIVVPSTVESISFGAFDGCTSLIKVKLTEGLISIGDYAFTNCTSLKDIVIPEGVENIGSYAFQACGSLTEINIPQSTKYVGYYAFGYYNGINVICGPMQKPAGWDAQWLYSGNVIWGYKCTYSDGKFTYDLYNDNTAVVTSYIGFDLNVVIPNSINYEGEEYTVTEIGSSAFESNKDIITVKFPNELITIGSSAFKNCVNIIKLEFSDTIKKIEDYAFGNCQNIVELTLPNQLEYIGSHSFWSCSNLESVSLPNSLKEIGSYAFSGCYNFNEVFIPKGIETIYDEAFGNNYKVIIYCEESSKPSGWVDNWVYKEYATVMWGFERMYSDNLFEYALMTDGTASVHKYIGTATNIEMNNTITVNGKTYTVTSLADYAFAENTVLKSVKLPSSITAVSSYAFRSCRSLETVIIQEGVTVIKECAFEYCENLTNVSLPSTLLKIDINAFYCCSALTSIVLPNKLAVIGNSAFSSCYRLSSIIIPKSVISIGGAAFGNGCFITVYCEANSKPSSWNSDWLYNGDAVWGFERIYSDNLFEYALMNDGTARILKYIGNATNIEMNNTISVNGKTYTITSLSAYSFADNTVLKSIKLPSTITEVSSYAFRGCRSLETVIIQEGVTVIKEYAFENCENLTNVSLPSTLLKIETWAFNCCYALTSIVLPNKFDVIGDYVFSSCNNLSSIIIPKSVTSIGYAAFGNGCLITVYCEATNKPASWNSDWAINGNASVVWGYTK